MADILFDDLNKIQKRVDRLLPLDFDPETSKKIKTLSSVIYHLVYLKKKAWHQKEGGPTKQKSGLMRSAEDIYNIGKKRIKDLTLVQVREALMKLQDAGMLKSHYCNTVCRRVHYNTNIRVPKFEKIKAIVKI